MQILSTQVLTATLISNKFISPPKSGNTVPENSLMKRFWVSSDSETIKMCFRALAMGFFCWWIYPGSWLSIAHRGGDALPAIAEKTRLSLALCSTLLMPFKLLNWWFLPVCLMERRRFSFFNSYIWYRCQEKKSFENRRVFVFYLDVWCVLKCGPGGRLSVI